MILEHGLTAEEREAINELWLIDHDGDGVGDNPTDVGPFCSPRLARVLGVLAALRARL